MPEQPDKSIEEQIKAWAEKRRAETGAPFELHPATRRLLQDDVARTIPTQPAKAASQPGPWLKLFWPRLAVAVSLFVALVAAVGILLPGLAKSKFKSQHLALVREHERVSSADSERRDAPAQVPPASSSRPMKAPKDHPDDAMVRSAAEESQPTALPALAESQSSEARVKPESKDVRLKGIEKPAKGEAVKTSGTSTPSELSYDQKLKEGRSLLPGAPATRDLDSANERAQELSRQRYGLIPGTAAGVAQRAEALTDEQKSRVAFPTAPAGPPVALDGAKVGPGIGGGGPGGRAASNWTAEASVALNNSPERATADDYSLALRQRSPVANRQSVVSLKQESEIDRPGTGEISANLAGANAAQFIQRYGSARKYRLNFNSPPLPNVLRLFEVEQIGQQIRVVDDDGSIYDGEIEQPPVKEALSQPSLETGLKKNLEPEARRTESAIGANVGQVASQTVFFRVAGTNLTLNQLVVFQGNFLASTNQIRSTSLGAKLSLDQPAVGPVQNHSLQGQQLPNDLIQGQATIGNSNRIQINASPVLRPE